MARETLTDRRLRSLKPAESGKRYDVKDALVPGLGVRVTGTGTITFTLTTRFPGSTNPTRRALGEYGALTLEQARDKAREWIGQIKKGIDPREVEQQDKIENLRKRENTWAAVVEDYLADIPNRKRNRHVEQDAREIRRELLQRQDKSGKVVWRNPWADRPIASVTDLDVAELIAAIRDRPAMGMAYNVLGHVKAVFDWATWPERRAGYGLDRNPVIGLKPKHIGLASKVDRLRTRVLSDDEIRAYWKAAEATPYPLGPFYKFLMLTGQRKAEVSDATWVEIDTAGNLWTIPPERFKMGQSHVVPLSPTAVALLESLPRFEGDCLFSTTGGAKPVNGFSRAKSALDESMLKILRESNPDATLPHWTFHDVRRTVRTRLSGLRVNSEIAELVIGHSKQGIERVYNHYQFIDEMRDALDRWAASLREIIGQPPADNVLIFPASA